QPEWVAEDDITLDFANSGQPEWVAEDDITLDFANSGQPEWVAGDDIILTAQTTSLFTNIKQITSRFNGFKNSGLPETIELSIAKL
ncbi:MAG: hypothetical protein WCR19_06320, partial [Acholeplasmataceae bacterium]